MRGDRGSRNWLHRVDRRRVVDVHGAPSTVAPRRSNDVLLATMVPANTTVPSSSPIFESVAESSNRPATLNQKVSDWL